MSFKKNILFLFLFFIVSCGGVEFLYDNSKNLTNPIYNKTIYEFSGKELSSIYRYSARYFGKTNNPNYILGVYVEEDKTKRSVQKNQAVSKLDYELKFNFKLTNTENGCLLYEKQITSRFSYVPKSSGYNFGSDQSLEKMYELAIKESLEKLIKFISAIDVFVCDNES